MKNYHLYELFGNGVRYESSTSTAAGRTAAASPLLSLLQKKNSHTVSVFSHVVEVVNSRSNYFFLLITITSIPPELWSPRFTFPWSKEIAGGDYSFWRNTILLDHKDWSARSASSTRNEQIWVTYEMLTNPGRAGERNWLGLGEILRWKRKEVKEMRKGSSGRCSENSLLILFQFPTARR